MQFRGPFRIYFNRSEDVPFVWSVDQGDVSTESKVQQVSVFGVNLLSDFRGTADNEHEPRAWVHGVGLVTIDGGNAVIEPVGR